MFWNFTFFFFDLKLERRKKNYTFIHRFILHREYRLGRFKLLSIIYVESLEVSSFLNKYGVSTCWEFKVNKFNRARIPKIYYYEKLCLYFFSWIAFFSYHTYTIYHIENRNITVLRKKLEVQY